VRITPPSGMPLSGYYYTRLAEGVHDDLHAKALVLETGGAKAALVACDLSSMPRQIVEEARRLIEQSTGLRGHQVMISATHTHTGPVLASGSARDALQGEAGEVVRQYMLSLPAKIAESVKLAEANLSPARASAGVGREESLSFNRRYLMKDGTVGWNPGKLNPNIVRPAGPIDPDVAVVYFDSPEARPLATYVNFPMHLDTVGGLQISADYPDTLASLLGKVRGPEMLTLFTIGTAGNINHLDVKSRDPQKGHAEAARIGTILAGEVLKTYARLHPLKAGTLQVRSEMLKLLLAEVKPGEVEKARQVAAQFDQPNGPKFLELVQAFKVLDVAAREGRPLEAEVQVIALGDQLAWVGLPGEIFVELGLAIKKASPFPYTVIAELANGAIGYVPNRKAYPEGNYEVVSTRLAAGSGELLVDAAIRLLTELAGSKPAN